MAALLTPAAVAARWSCSPRHVRRLAQQEKLTGVRVGDLWRFSLAAVEAYEQRQGSATTRSAPKASPQPPRLPSQAPAIDLDGAYALVVKGPVPWRTEVIQ